MKPTIKHLGLTIEVIWDDGVFQKFTMGPRPNPVYMTIPRGLYISRADVVERNKMAREAIEEHYRLFADDIFKVEDNNKP